MPGVEKSLSYLKHDPRWGAEKLPSVPEVPLFEIIDPTIKRLPNKAALFSFGGEVTYKQLDDMSDRLAAALADMGIKKGDRVGVVLPNCAQAVIAFHGIIKAGAVSVPCNVMSTPADLTYIFNDAGVAVVLCLDLLCPSIQNIKANTGIRQVISVHPLDISGPGGWIPALLSGPKTSTPECPDFTSLLERYKPGRPRLKFNPREDLALVIYTAGTLGVPKGVMQTHYAMVYTTLINGSDCGVDGNDVAIQILPMFHISGYYQMLYPVLYRGGSVVMVPMFDAGAFLKLIDTCKVTFIVAPPTLYVGLLNHPDLPKYNLRNMKATIAGAAPVPAALQQSWQKTTGLELNQGWGMTETNGGAILSLPNKKNTDSIGVPRNGEVKIIDKDGKTLPRGEVGEIMFRGPQVAKGYWNKLEETAKTFEPDGWLHTGDAGYIGEDDFVYFVERIKDLIVASGYNIAPFEVESVILTNPAVREVSVIGVPDEYRGETVKAFIVLKDEYRGKTTESEIIEFCKDRLAAYKRPHLVEFIPELPKNTVGKVLRRELRVKK